MSDTAVESDTKRPRGRRWPKRLAIAAVVLLAVVAGAWPAFFHWAKSTGRLERWLGQRPERFQMRWSELSSPLPFVFDAKQIVVAVRTTQLRWELTAERARFAVDPFALLDRRLVLRQARLSGVELLVLHERPPEIAGPPAPGAPIARPHGTGENRPRISAFAEGPPPAGRGLAKPWSWVVSDLEFRGMKRLWIDDVALTGGLGGSTSFSIERRLEAEVTSFHLNLDGATATLDGAELARELGGALELRVAPWHYLGAGSDEVVPRLQAKIDLRGEIATGPALRYLFGDRSWLALGAKRSRIELALAVDRGRMRAGSRLDASLIDPELEAFGFVARGQAHLTAEVSGEIDRETLHSRLALDGWTLARPDEAPLFSGDGLTVDAELVAPRVDEQPRGGTLAIDLGRGRADDLRFLNDLLPKSAGVSVAGGALELGGKLAFDAGDRSGGGKLALTGKRLELLVRDQKFGADLAIDVQLARADLAAGSFALDGSTLALRDVAAATSAGGTVQNWWAESELASGRVTLKKPFESHGEFKARFADTRPVIAFYELKRDLPGWAEKTLLLEDVHLSGRYRATIGQVRMSDVRLPLASGEARAELDLTKARRQARLLLTWHKLALGLELDNEKRDLHLVHARDWFEKSPLALP